MKLRWNCEKKGCFNRVKRPKIEAFDDCLPGKIEFGDVDAIVEIKGRALILEWKPSQEIGKGQQIMWTRLTRDKVLTAFVVAGDAETMDVQARGKFWEGKWRGWKPSTLDEVKEAIRLWVAWAEANRLV
jgi:hypothetical protein